MILWRKYKVSDTLAMTRIIQRCLLVLAFTGVLLSYAQEATVSNVSHSMQLSDQMSTSAPETSYYEVGNSSLGKVENESSHHSDSSSSSSKPDLMNVSKSPVNESSNDATLDRAKSDSHTTSFTDLASSGSNMTESDGSGDNEITTTAFATTTSDVYHSEDLTKSEEQDAEPYVLNANKTFGKQSNTSEKVSNVSSLEKFANIVHELNDFEKGFKDIGNETFTSEMLTSASSMEKIEKTTVNPEMRKSAEMDSENLINDSGPSSVPSGDVFVYNSIYVASSQTHEKMHSTKPSDVETDFDMNDPKSATHKRSLNSTNTATSSGLTSSISSADLSTPMIDMQLSNETTEKTSFESLNDSTLVPKQNEDSPLHAVSNDSLDENETTVSSYSLTAEATMSSSVMNTDAPIFKDSTRRSENIAEMVLKTSPSSQDVTYMSSKSSVALSTSSRESINPTQDIGTMGQMSHLSYEISTMSPTPHRSHIEMEDGPLTSSSDSSENEPLITFDPNGMTNNYTQDPDSITFTPNIFHVDGIPTDGFLSRLETDDSDNNNSTTKQNEKLKDGTSNDNFKLQSNFSELEGVNASEREREFISSSPGLLPHDEPDQEELSDILRNTKPPMEDKYTTDGTLKTRITESGISSKPPVHLLNDESEEMLNDAPEFIQFQSTFAPTKKDEIHEENVFKVLNMNVSNDISSTTGFIPHSTPKNAHELDFSVVYQTEESAIRPVTVASPSESSTLLSDSLKVESLLPSTTPKSEQPDTVLPDTSSPVILPNPAPSITNQSAEATTVVLQPVFVPENNESQFITDRENGTTQNPNSTIAGLAVKTSVSVSLPISVSNESTSSTQDQNKNSSNKSSEFASELPVPGPVNNGADTSQSTPVSTETPTTVSTGFGIRKPKPMVAGIDEPSTPRTRKPYVPPRQRSSTTAGPPVSIFKKARTRIASITSSTTARPLREFSTIRIHYASRIPGIVPGGELVISTEPITTTIATTTETEEPFSDEPFTEQTQVPIVTKEDDVTLVKVAGYIVFDKGLRWAEQLDNRHSPQYREKANFVHLQLERLFRTSPVGPHLWKIQIDGFSGKRNSRSVAVDFFLYLVKSKQEIPAKHLTAVFHEKLKNNTFSRFTVDPTQTSFEFVKEEPLKPSAPPLEEMKEPVIPQWAIAVIVVGAASLIFIILFAAVAVLGRHHVRRRYTNKLDEEDSDRPSDWESKMAAAYENLAADTIYDAEDLHSDTYKKSCSSTYHGRPSRARRADSWSSSDWSPAPRRPRPQVHRIVY